MATKGKTNIAQINRYVKGKLDAPGMHSLERETYDDAFLNEAMEGFEGFAADDHEETLAELKAQLHKRAAQEKKGVVAMWRMLTIAASLVLMLGAGYWILKPDPIKPHNTQANLKDTGEHIAVNKPAPQITIPNKGNLMEDGDVKPKRKLVADAGIEPERSEEPEAVLREVTITGVPSVKYKTDTVEYVASDYQIRANASIEDLLKKIPSGFEIDTMGSVTFNGQPVTKARLNGKDYMGGDVNQAIQSLPADIVEKFQVVDDYGDQAGRTGIRSGDAAKVLNLTTGKERDLTSAAGYSINEPTFYSPQVIYKTDTIEYITNNYPIQNEAKIWNVINRLPGFERDGNGLLFQGKSIKKIQVNSVDDKGKAMLGITEKLPADVLEKVQVIDDYRDMAANTFKVREPDKVVNLVVRDIKNRRLPWAHNLNGVTIPGDTVETPKPIIGWKKYADYIRSNIKTSTKSEKEMMVFFYVAPDGTLSNINVTRYAAGVNVADIVKNGPKWLGYSEPRQVWFKIKME